VQEVQLAEVLDDGLLDRAPKAEVELFERIPGREAGRLDPRPSSLRSQTKCISRKLRSNA
jgi:hypothetical protein